MIWPIPSQFSEKDLWKKHFDPAKCSPHKIGSFPQQMIVSSPSRLIIERSGSFACFPNFWRKMKEESKLKQLKLIVTYCLKKTFIFFRKTNRAHKHWFTQLSGDPNFTKNGIICCSRRMLTVNPKSIDSVRAKIFLSILIIFFMAT